MRYLAAALAAFLGVAIMATPAMSAPVGTPTHTANGFTSPYLLYTDVDRTKEVGLLLWMDGSGGYGIDNPTSPYLIDSDGTAGMRQVARDNNMVLLVPEAPPPGCPSDNCWYDSANAIGKSDWLRSLVDKVQAEQSVVKSRVAIGGYSSGAQATTRYFGPRHGPAVQTDGVLVAVGGGGTPIATPTFTTAYKQAVVGVWNTGTADETSTYSAYEDAQRGEAWYRGNGFVTDPTWPAGVGHSRGGEFDDIMRQAIAEHVRPAQTVGTTTPTPEEPTAPAPWETTVDPTRTGGTFKVNVPSGYSGRVYVRLSSGNYLYDTVTGPATAEVTFQSQQCGRTMTWRTEAPSGTARDSGSFTTDPC